MMVSSSAQPYETNGLEIAIIGMAGRFPGAENIEQFWQNLRDGVESVTFFSDQALEAAGVDAKLREHPHYVKARAILGDVAQFDATFFGYTPREAEVTDPQHRLFLECAYTALEQAGYTSETYDGAIGVFAGSGRSTYLYNYLMPNRALIEDSIGIAQTMLGNDKDNLATLVSYKLNLQGPGITIQTACSTSLVAIHLACQSLLGDDCQIALAGGVRLFVPQESGYFFFEGGINSPDGHCRTFDAQARGIVGGNGVGVIVLKRLEDALAAGDTIHAVIKGSAINNDGAQKVGYTAPSVDGQAKVIRAAQELAEVAPETIGYIEAHGTGTALGDPIEITALTQAFRAGTTQNAFCAIGSLKTNVGHLDASAGIASVIKTVLALQHQQIPPSLHYQTPNPAIDFATTPFYVNTRLAEWPATAGPRRAGVSAFGIGGTNAHAIIEEAPPAEHVPSARPWHTLILSAKTSTALTTMTARLAEHFRQHPELHLADAAYTLQVGRRAFEHRRAVVCHDLADAATALSVGDPRRVFSGVYDDRPRPVAFMFPGQGTQYVGMAAELYQVEPLFRAQVDHCAELLVPHLGCDLRGIMFDASDTGMSNHSSTDDASRTDRIYPVPTSNAPGTGAPDSAPIVDASRTDRIYPVPTADAPGTGAPDSTPTDDASRTDTPNHSSITDAPRRGAIYCAPTPEAGTPDASRTDRIYPVPTSDATDHAPTDDASDAGAIYCAPTDAISGSSFVVRHSSGLAPDLLAQTQYAQPALFVIEFALAQLWMSWGITPQSMIGHSIGEYVAACLAGVFTLADALALVAARGRLIQALPPGAMLTVGLPEHELRALLPASIALAAVNGPARCVVAGPAEAISALHDQLRERGVDCRPLHTSHAFHSPMLDPMLATFTSAVEKVTLKPPRIPYISNVTGTWATAAQATDPVYWASHLRQTVRFADGVQTLLREGPPLLLEVGPGNSLSTFVKGQRAPAAPALLSLRHPQEAVSDVAFIQNALAQLWLAGGQVDWAKQYGDEQRRRVPLPSYPFERQRYWVDTSMPAHAAQPTPSAANGQTTSALHSPSWQYTRTGMAAAPTTDAAAGYLVFAEQDGLGTQLLQRLAQIGQDVVVVTAGQRFARLGEHAYSIDPRQPHDYAALLAELRAQGQAFQQVVHLWSVPPAPVATDADAESERFSRSQTYGAASLLFLAQALAHDQPDAALQLVVVASELHSIAGEVQVQTDKTTILGVCVYIRQAYPHIGCRSIDIAPMRLAAAAPQSLVEALVAELTANTTDSVTAYRTSGRWVQTIAPITSAAAPGVGHQLRTGGAYLLSGSLDATSIALAAQLAQQSQAELIVLAPSALPEPAEWAGWLEAPEHPADMRWIIQQLQTLERSDVTITVLHEGTRRDAKRNHAFAHLRIPSRITNAQLRGVIHSIGEPADTPSQRRQIPAAYDDEIVYTQVAELRALEQTLHGHALDFCLVLDATPARSTAPRSAEASAVSQFAQAFVEQHNQADQLPWSYLRLPTGANATALSSHLGDLSKQISALHTLAPILLYGPDRSPAEDQRTAHAADHTTSAVLANAQDQDAAAHTPLVLQLTSIWQDLLGVKQIGMHDDFFQLGGQSLLGIQLAARLRETFGLEIPLQSLFEASTIAGLAALIETVQQAGRDYPLAPPPATDDLEQGDL